MPTDTRTQNVYVAMSGGVDSSVAAALLKKQGYAVTGVFMKPWQAPGVRCLWQEDRQDALMVAAALDIPLLTWDFSTEYGERVTQYLLDGYRQGITPNPDVMCNKEIKFGLFLERALSEGADLIATGHYVRRSKTRQGWALRTGIDPSKDQSYFLWTLNQHQVEKSLFPIGDYLKKDVRAMAKKFGLPTHAKKDSQGVCFVGELAMHDFLRRYLPSRPGDIIHTSGRVVGRHDGAQYYTIGQRHGLNISDGHGPYFVVSKDIANNIITVGDITSLLGTRAQLSHVHWISGETPRALTNNRPISVQARIRYRAKPASALLHMKDNDATLEFKKPQRALTPGQSAVLYRGQTMLGGATIVSGEIANSSRPSPRAGSIRVAR